MFKVNDSVVVKQDIRDIDLKIDIGGWQGRVEEIEPGEEEEMLLVRWDSVTLREMPDEMIEVCEERGLSWEEYYIEASNVEPARPRDIEEDVEQVAKELGKKHAWAWLGEEGRRIQKMLSGVDPDDRWACMKAWGEYFKGHLTFPFEAEVKEFQERGPLQAGDRVKVKKIIITEDLYGVIVRVTRGRRRYDFPLCDLEALDEKSPNYQMIRDYRVWFANY